MPYSNTDIIAHYDMKINALRHLPQIRQSEGGCQGRFTVLANGLNHCFFVRSRTVVLFWHRNFESRFFIILALDKNN